MVSIQRGGSTLDTWVSTLEEVDTFSMLPQRVKRNDGLPSQGGVLISSRTAENMFWLGRYTERSESLTRLAKESLLVASISGEDNVLALQDAISELTIRSGLISADAPTLSKSPKVFTRTLIASLISKDAYSVGFYLQAIDSNLKLVRDRLPSDHSRLAGTMKTTLESRLGEQRSVEEKSLIVALEALDNLGLQLAALTGLQSDRMTRDLGWRMLTIGRLIERLIHLAETLSTFFLNKGALNSRGFDMLLALFDSTITYRTRYQSYQDMDSLIELLILDDTNPRAIVWILNELQQEIHFLPNTDSEIDIYSQLIKSCMPIEGAFEVISFSKRVAQAGKILSDELSARYFAHIKEQRFAS
jgi:uncharacterized alpha-E superfamily protein